MRVDSWCKLTADDGYNFDLLRAKLMVPNPEYISREKLGFSTRGIPKFDQLYLDVGDELWIPRALAQKYGAGRNVEDLRTLGWGEVDFKSRIKLGPNKLIPEDQSTFVEKMVEALETRYGAIGQAGAGAGKAQPLSSLVMTVHGPKKMGDIKVEDELIAPSGGTVRVVGVYPQGKLPTYRVTLNDGTSMECNDEHLFKVQEALDRNNGTNRWQVLTLAEIMKAGLRRPNGRIKWYLPMTKPAQFKEQELPLSPYLLGCLLADGIFGPQVMFSSQEDDILEAVAAELPDSCKLVYTGYGTDYSIVRNGGGRNNEVHSILRSLGLWGKRSYEKYVPKKYLYNTVENRLALLQGLFDCDGSVYKDGTTFEYSTSSKRLAEDVVFLVQSLGGTVRVVNRVPQYTYKGEKRKGRLSWRLYIKLPETIVPFRSKKHLSAYTPRTKYGVYRNIVSVEYVGEKEMQCIQVDGEEKLYLTDNFIVTHNTVMALEIISRLRRPAAVVVHKSFLMSQWKERILQFLDVKESEIGIVQTDTCDYKGKKIVLMMVQSLLAREYPKELYESFGLVCFDEVHRFGATEFRKAVTKFPAKYRMGLTATPYRSDGLEKVFFWHIGEIAVVGAKKRLKPRIEIVNTGVQVSELQLRNMRDHTGNVNLNKAIQYLIDYEGRNMLIVDLLIRALKAGRKIIVLSSRLDHLYVLENMVKRAMLRENLRYTIGYYIGGMSEIDRKISATRDLILATYQMSSEGLDIPALDTLFMVTPRGDIEQAVGRILREHPDKKEPLVLDFVDYAIPICYGLARKRMNQYRKLGYV